LEKIAKNNGTSVKAIKSLNNLKTDRINAGQKLKLPAKGAEAARTGEVVPVPYTVSTIAAR
jgi:LysM repeat protein